MGLAGLLCPYHFPCLCLQQDDFTTRLPTAYQIGTRNANTVLRLLDGETQILAGLISREDRAAANRVPGLGDLPIAGRLFSSQKDEYQRTELVLAITPRILRPAPRPTIAQAELWIGSEANTRLRSIPQAIQMPAREGSRTQSVVQESQVTSANVAAGQSQEAGVVSMSQNAQVVATAVPKSVAIRWRAPQAVKAGESFSVAIEVSTGLELRGLPIEMMFSPDLLEVVSIAEGELLKQGDGATSFAQAVNAVTGRVNVRVVRNEGRGVVGDGVAVSVQFKAKAAGTAQLRFTSVQPIGGNGPLPLQALPTASIGIQ